MPTLTFDDYATAWVERRRSRGRPLSPRTQALYRVYLRVHLLPVLGDTLVSELTRSQVLAWYQQLAGPDGARQMTAAKCYRLLRAICGTAVEEELLTANPCTLKGAGDEWSPERPVLTVQQVLDLADAVDERWRALVLLGAFCSLRFGELSALRRTALDLAAGTVSVLATAGQASGQGRVVSPPKSAAGRRILTIPAAVRPDIERHLATYACRHRDGLVFVGPLGGALHNNSFGTTIWRPACDQLGLTGVRFHDLRHTGNTLAAATGASLADLMARMGHASTEAALRYQHATRPRDEVLADALSHLITQARAS